MKLFFKINKIGTVRNFLFKKYLIRKNGGDISHLTTFREGFILAHELHGVWIAPYNFGGLTVIHQNVTVGNRVGKINTGKSDGFLFIGAGAFIAADINIGENVIIGANAVVTKNVPANTIVLGSNEFTTPNNFDDLLSDMKERFYKRKKLQNHFTEEQAIAILKIYEIRKIYDYETSKNKLKEFKNLYFEQKKVVRPPIGTRLF